MTEIDFSDCRYIHENMSFYTYYDFCDGAKVLKKMYKSLSKDGKTFYKWYVYANIHMSETFKNAIWEYLNFDDPDSYIHLMELKRIYKAK